MNSGGGGGGGEAMTAHHHHHHHGKPSTTHSTKQASSTILTKNSHLRATSASTEQQVRKQKLPMWIEWNENDLNAEKWEGGGKATKESGKGKPASAPVNIYIYIYIYIREVHLADNSLKRRIYLTKIEYKVYLVIYQYL